MWKFLWRSLEQEHQPSIRHMLEWEVMWLMYRHEEYRKQIWILLEKVLKYAIEFWLVVLMFKSHSTAWSYGDRTTILNLIQRSAYKFWQKFICAQNILGSDYPHCLINIYAVLSYRHEDHKKLIQTILSFCVCW